MLKFWYEKVQFWNCVLLFVLFDIVILLNFFLFIELEWVFDNILVSFLDCSGWWAWVFLPYDFTLLRWIFWDLRFLNGFLLGIWKHFKWDLSFFNRDLIMSWFFMYVRIVEWDYVFVMSQISIDIEWGFVVMENRCDIPFIETRTSWAEEIVPISYCWSHVKLWSVCHYHGVDFIFKVLQASFKVSMMKKRRTILSFIGINCKTPFDQIVS